MNTLRNICIVLSDDDLSPENIASTVKTIEHSPNKFYLLAVGSRKKLWETVEELGKSVEDDNTLTKMRIAYDLNFDLQTTLNIGNSNGVEVKSFADLLERLDFDENLNLTRADYHVIISDDNSDADAANQAVMKLFHQTVYLNIATLDIRKKSDMRRPIRIAVIGTKKAGKSTLINNLLKHDYAPTNLILSTPNTIKYVPDNKLFLEYGGKTYKFDTAAELSQFIGGEYKRTCYSAGLPNMTIHYPCNERGYEIWDTPGFNVAFTDEHERIAAECISETDVCIFVMNYSNHLTNDEVNFLQKIRPVVKDKPFVVAVNRIDERYAFDEEKSVAKILDYVRCRLEELGYKNFAVFGTSALQNFYLDKVVELAAADDLPINFDSIRPLIKRHRDALPQIKFIGDALGNLKDFHDIEEPTDKEIRAFSSVPQLIRHVNKLGAKIFREGF